MHVSSSGYYAWRTREASPRAQANVEPIAAIHDIHRDTERAMAALECIWSCSTADTAAAGTGSRV